MRYKHILVVDDDPDLLFLVSHGVKTISPDFQVTTSPNALNALELVKKQPFDLIVTDYMMPEMTGLDFVSEARQISPETRYILMTAHHDTNRIKHNVDEFKLGGFIGKPFTMSELIDVIQHVAAEKEAISEPDTPPGPLSAAAIGKSLQELRHQTGATSVLLINSQGHPVHSEGDTNPARISRLAAFVASNFLAITELSSLFGDNDAVFQSSYYQGNKYNVYALNINGNYFLAVLFGTQNKPGTIWLYTKEAAALLVKLLPKIEKHSNDALDTALSNDFETLLGNG